MCDASNGEHIYLSTGRRCVTELRQSYELTAAGLLVCLLPLWQISNQATFPLNSLNFLTSVFIHTCQECEVQSYFMCHLVLLYFQRCRCEVGVSAFSKCHISDYLTYKSLISKSKSYLILENLILFVCVSHLNFISAKHLIKVFISLWICFLLVFFFSFLALFSSVTCLSAKQITDCNLRGRWWKQQAVWRWGSTLRHWSTRD